MRFEILTLFPEMVEEPLKASIIGKAIANGLLEVGVWNIRDYALDKHRIVDDTPYGGGAGMVLKADVLARAIEDVKGDSRTPVIYLSPQGRVFNQALAQKLAGLPRLILLSGHYEEIDERVRRHWVDLELSIGDYVLTGGELPALVVVDAVARLLPGVLGDQDSHRQDSFQAGLLDCPHYTRPAQFRGLKVPEVLLSGHHERIRRFRLKEALRRTLERRPDLLRRRRQSREEKLILQELINEFSQEGREITMNLIESIEQEQLRSDRPDFSAGDTVRVHVKVVEGSNERIQIFEGVVLRRMGGSAREAFTVRKISQGVGVERTFPVHSPRIDKIEVMRRGKVRRARLYYLRERSGRAARIKERRN